MKINDKLESAKRRLADKLGTLSERFSTKTKKWAVILTGLACATICIATIAIPFIKTKKTPLYGNEAMPVVIRPQEPSSLLSVEEYQLLQGFIHTMDSLKYIDKEAYQKAITGREGMIDSILFLLRHSGEALIKK